MYFPLISLKFQSHISNCLCDISTYVSNSYESYVSKTELLICTPNLFFQFFPIPIKGQLQSPSTSVINLDIILDFSFYHTSLPISQQIRWIILQNLSGTLPLLTTSAATAMILGTIVSYVVYFNSLPEGRGLSASTFGCFNLFSTRKLTSQSVSLFCPEPSNGFSFHFRIKASVLPRTSQVLHVLALLPL